MRYGTESAPPWREGLVQAVFVPEELNDLRIDVSLALLLEIHVHWIARRHVADKKSYGEDSPGKGDGLNQTLENVSPH